MTGSGCSGTFRGDAPASRFFLGVDGNMSAPLQLQVSELLVSAFLRTLAYAMHIGRLRSGEAEACSMLALPVNQGLADVEPIARPKWCRDLGRRWRESRKGSIQELWADAATSCCSAETPASLTIIETDENNLVEVDIELVAARGEQDLSKGSIPSARPVVVEGPPGRMAGKSPSARMRCISRTRRRVYVAMCIRGYSDA